MNKVYGGTRDGADTLCTTCRAGLTVTGKRMGDDRIFCRAVGVNGSSGAREMTSAVSMCSGYDDSRLPTRWDFEQIAWELTTSPSRKVGFLSPQERAARNGMSCPPPTR